MTLTWKDAAATVLTTLAVLVYAAAHQSWNVWLIGSSNRWAAGVVLLLGIGACSLGTAGEEMGRHSSTRALAALGALSLVFGLWALVTASLTALALLVVCTVVLWAGSTLRHAWHPTHRPLAD
ncbi:MAG TPA: hypothetical protein VMT59_08490 [Gaiellaceae bacterium]|nr:hypothetical protein [Gaiellaceae bacterium]